MLFKNIAILDENFQIQQNKYVVTEGDRVKYIGETMPEGYTGKIFSGQGKLLMPGFYNGHAHSPMTLMRGYGENLSLSDWLTKKIFPFEDKLNDQAVYWGTLLAMAESVETGIVSTSDMYFFHQAMVEAIDESYCKNNISRAIVNTTSEDFNKLQSVADMEDLLKLVNGLNHSRIKVDASLHAEYTSDQTTVTALAQMAKDMGLAIHLHLSESQAEHQECKQRHNGLTPTAYLNSCGLFDVPAFAAHCVWVEDQDIEILKNKNVSVITNPISNLKLASGICPVKKLVDKGINVAIGTDGVASNNSLNFFEEMKTVALLAKYKDMDPTALSPKEILYMATRGGALAQGRLDCGLLKEGYKADLIVIDLNRANMAPFTDIIGNLVLAANPSNIYMTMVDGKVLYLNGQHQVMDVEKIIWKVREATKHICSLVGR